MFASSLAMCLSYLVCSILHIWVETKYCWHVIALSFNSVRGSYTLCECMNIWCIYEVRMSSTLAEAHRYSTSKSRMQNTRQNNIRFLSGTAPCTDRHMYVSFFLLHAIERWAKNLVFSSSFFHFLLRTLYLEAEPKQFVSVLAPNHNLIALNDTRIPSELWHMQFCNTNAPPYHYNANDKHRNWWSSIIEYAINTHVHYIWYVM